MRVALQRLAKWALLVLAPVVALLVLFATFFRVKATNTYWVEPIQTVLNLIVVWVCLKALFPWPAVLGPDAKVARLRRASRIAAAALALLSVLLTIHALSSVRNELVVATLALSAFGAAFLAAATRFRASAVSVAQQS
jgi:hypothetical protein